MALGATPFKTVARTATICAATVAGTSKFLSSMAVKQPAPALASPGFGST